jgi:hypothetical protein
MQHEYRVLATDNLSADSDEPAQLEAALNLMAATGWQLVTACPRGASEVLFIFRRDASVRPDRAGRDAT